jgi:predicted transcriptional regulator
VATNSDNPSGSEKQSNSTSSEETVWHRWTFLTNHAHVLIALQANPGMILREVAQEVGITERAVQRIVQELEEQGYLVRHKVGRKNQYEVLSDLPLRHPLECHRTIGDLLRLITGSKAD